MNTRIDEMKVVVLIPCYNEALTIEKVILDFKKELPEADIYVYDNNSSDGTSSIARNAGANVRYEYQQGKGNVVRKMFSDINADIYVLVDGDDTYPAEVVKQMIEVLVSRQADMVTGDRLSNGSYSSENKRLFHDFGNNLVRNTINILFHANVKDIMTGYRVFSDTFVKNWPVMSSGFEIETEMTLHVLDKKFVIEEVPIDYRDRPAGSESKLNTLSDGIKVMKTIVTVCKDYKPLFFYSIWALVFCLCGLGCGIPVIYEYIRYSYIYHIPLTILAASLEMLAMNFLTCGLILDTVAKNEKKNFELRLIDYKMRKGRRNE